MRHRQITKRFVIYRIRIVDQENVTICNWLRSSESPLLDWSKRDDWTRSDGSGGSDGSWHLPIEGKHSRKAIGVVPHSIDGIACDGPSVGDLRQRWNGIVCLFEGNNVRANYTESPKRDSERSVRGIHPVPLD
jgi:hypothetical protein